MMDKLLSLKDGVVRKLATSIILKAIDGHKTNISRVFQGINMIVAAFYLIAPIVDLYVGTELSANLDAINAKYLLLLQTLAGFGLELGLHDKAAKERAAK